MELASLNCKNNIDVIVNQFFRELPKRWMLLQNTTEKKKRSLVGETLHFIYDTIQDSKATLILISKYTNEC